MKVQVKQEHIDRSVKIWNLIHYPDGARRDDIPRDEDGRPVRWTESCPIALALDDVFPGTKARVGSNLSSVGFRCYEPEKSLPTKEVEFFPELLENTPAFAWPSRFDDWVRHLVHPDLCEIEEPQPVEFEVPDHWQEKLKALCEASKPEPSA